MPTKILCNSTLRPLLAVAVLLLAACSAAPSKEVTPEPVLAETPEPELAAPPCDCPEPPTAAPPATELRIVGAVEYVVIGDNVMQQKARVDTGATTTSVGIKQLEVYERDGESWVKFTIEDRVLEETADFERKLVRRVQIKRHNASPDERPVVTMPLTMGPIQRTVEVTLNNRDSFEYPVLIGRNFLDGHAVVDVSRQYIAMDEESE
jgi:hypothetical protein